ncbi:MAG: DUF5615 family PIN-like protein [Tepidiformaceae bacterium]
MIALYLDEDALDRHLIQALRSFGIDVLTAHEAGRLGCTDAEQLEFATSLGRVLYTFNVVDYARLHAEWLRAGHAHAGLILIHDQRMPVGEQAARAAWFPRRAQPQRWRTLSSSFRVGDPAHVDIALPQTEPRAQASGSPGRPPRPHQPTASSPSPPCERCLTLGNRSRSGWSAVDALPRSGLDG